MRTPLNAIIGFSELLEKDSTLLSKEQQEFFHPVSQAGHHLLGLINDLYSFVFYISVELCFTFLLIFS